MTEAEKARGARWGKIRRRAARCRRGSPFDVLPQQRRRRHSGEQVCRESAWLEVSAWLAREGFQRLAIGSSDDARDSRYAGWQGERAYALPIRDVAALLAASHAVLSVDTGIRHLAAAVGANLYCVSGAVPLSLIKCVPVHERQRVYEVAIAVSDVDARVLVDGASRVL